LSSVEQVTADRPSADGPGQQDGRRLRSQDSRKRIVLALLALVQAGDVSPSAEQVAARAGVGLRTVFRHFKDMDSLYSEMAQAIEVEVREVVNLPFEAEDWRGKVLELIPRRSMVFERITPFRRASDAHRPRSAFLEAGAARMVAIMRQILRGLLPEEVARDEQVFEALDLLLSFESWSRLRRDQGLAPGPARAVLDAAVRRIID
jgi:AcrR family transcriptional regulator